MKNVSKTAILPIVSTLLLGIGYVVGHKFSADVADMVSTIAVAAINAGIVIWGVLKNHKKEVK